MKKVFSAITVMAFIVLFAQFVAAQVEITGAAAKKPGKKPGGIAVRTVTAMATVDAVDAEKRTVTLKFADGGTQPYKLGPEVKNFDRIKAGDQVKATYAESVAVFVRKSNEPPVADETQTVQVAPKGAKPGLIATDTNEITAKVEAVNYKKRTVTLKGPEGNTRTFTVDKGVKKLKNVKIGDELVVRFTEAVVITVEKPQ